MPAGIVCQYLYEKFFKPKGLCKECESRKMAPPDVSETGLILFNGELYNFNDFDKHFLKMYKVQRDERILKFYSNLQKECSQRLLKFHADLKSECSTQRSNGPDLPSVSGPGPIKTSDTLKNV
uniref:Uncharacterized protein n=1 Tax=Acrobeloides nanus TaxID=290746 RepID=A0A914E6I3_9BILA